MARKNYYYCSACEMQAKGTIYTIPCSAAYSNGRIAILLCKKCLNMMAYTPLVFSKKYGRRIANAKKRVHRQWQKWCQKRGYKVC